MRGGGAARAAEQEVATLRAKVAVAEGVAEAGVAYLKFEAHAEPVHRQ